MLPIARYVILLAFIVVGLSFTLSQLTLLIEFQVCLHFILRFTHESYERATSFDYLSDKFRWNAQSQYQDSHANLELADRINYYASLMSNSTRRANATLLMLARNDDVDGAVQSVRALEDRFNYKYGYPWVFLNEVPFDENFVSCVSLSFLS